MNWQAGIKGAITGFNIAFLADYAAYKSAPEGSNFNWKKALTLWAMGAVAGFITGLGLEGAMPTVSAGVEASG